MVASCRRTSLALLIAGVALQITSVSANCPDDPEVDLCDIDETSLAPTQETTSELTPGTTLAPVEADGAVSERRLMSRFVMGAILLASTRGATGTTAWPMVLAPLAISHAAAVEVTGTCGEVKEFYKSEECCGNPEQALTSAPAWTCSSPSGSCDCERLKVALAGVPGAVFPTEFCTHMEHLKPVGHRSAPICEASDALGEASLMVDGQPGNVNFPHGLLKVVATVGEVNPQTGAMLTGVPDGNGAYLKDDETLRYIYQSESYGPLSRQESVPYFVNEPEHVGFTGSHIHHIDFDRSLLAQYFEAAAPPNAQHMISDSGEAISKVYNLERELVGKREVGGASSRPHHSNVNLTGHYIVSAEPTKADWLMQSLCSAHLAPKFQWGEGFGVQDDLFVTNEEWISYQADAEGIVGLPAHVLNLASGELWATSAFGLGGFEKIVEVNTASSDFVAWVPSGYNGNFGGSFPQVVAERNAQYTRTDGQPYVWPQDIRPTALYLGKKDTAKDGTANANDFLSRNGFEFGAMYGFATDCSDGTPGAEGRDAWHKNTAAAGSTVTGAFYKLRWSDTPGEVRDFVHDLAWEFQDTPEGAPAGWCFWNANGNDASGAKTEHVSPDPRGGHRVLQGSTAGYFGIYSFPDLPSLVAGGSFPDSIPATYTCLQPESDIRDMIELGGAGMYADGQDATVNPDEGQNPGKATFEDIDGMEWLAAADGEDFIVIHEDSGNDFGERKFLARVGTPLTYYFVAMSGGSLNSRELAGVSSVEGVHRSPSSHEFSGATDLSGLLAKNADGTFRLAAGAQNGMGRSIEAEVPVNEKDIIVSLQAHSNWAGWTESFHPDSVGQILLYRPALPTEAR